jgi:hypothetical protein
MATETIRPSADDTDGNWTNEAAGTTLYTSIDESAASDVDYIQSGDDPANDLCKIKLASPVGTPLEPFYVRFRFKKDGVSEMNLTVRLFEGASTIASWAYADIADTYVTEEETLTAPQFASITDFTNLYLTFTANLAAGGLPSLDFSVATNSMYVTLLDDF